MAGKLKKLTQSQVEESIKMYESGLSLQSIGTYFGVTRQAMWDLLRRRISLRSRKRCGSDNHFFRGGSRADKRSQDIVEAAVNCGALVRPEACDECGKIPDRFKDGRSGIQAHHDDYGKPLDVRWLCQKCHHEWHKSNTPVNLVAP